jgi:hypothetical protein
MEKEEQTAPRDAGLWIDALTLAKKSQDTWEKKGEKIVKRYRDDRGSNESYSSNTNKYNILWSNIRTLFPAVYGKKPQAQAERRFKDADPVGRAASEILERALQYEIDHYSDYDASIKNAILDRLLPGRGVAWVRYSNDSVQITDDVEAENESDENYSADTMQSESSENTSGHECSPCDYVFWKDFRHSPARTWEEVTWIARRVYMAKDEVIERFGEEYKNITLSHEPIGLDDLKSTDSEKMKKAIIWEIWDKNTKSAIWVGEGYPTILDEKQDPLELDNFWPCPKPLFSTLTSDSLIPVADYLMYQDQAKELDTLTDRISRLSSACKVVGVYDSSSTALARMLDEGVDNVMIPVDTWAAFGEKGGLKGSVDFMPLDMVVMTLTQLYAAREQCKQVIYEVTGLSDIIRGASVASETATAQNIKSQYASLRLKEMQNEVARFASDLLRIKAQIMCKLYSPQTLMDMSGIQGTLDGQNQQLVQQALQLLKTDSMRNFKIEVASDSLIEIDEQGEKQSRLEFLAAAGSFIEKAIQVPPELVPLMGEMLMFGVRSFKASKPIEAAFEEAMQKLTQPKPPQSDPAAAQAQADQQKIQADQQQKQAEMQAGMQLEQAKMQASAQALQMKAEFDIHMAQMKAQQEDTFEAQRLEFDKWKAELEASTKVTVANIQASTSLKQSAMTANGQVEGGEYGDNGEVKPSLALNAVVEAINQNMLQLMDVQQQHSAAISEEIRKPKRRVIQRDENGRAVGAIEVTE